jgi:hypothetical protein
MGEPTIVVHLKAPSSGRNEETHKTSKCAVFDRESNRVFLQISHHSDNMLSPYLYWVNVAVTK